MFSGNSAESGMWTEECREGEGRVKCVESECTELECERMGIPGDFAWKI